jgi:hypothetical protein
MWNPTMKAMKPTAEILYQLSSRNIMLRLKLVLWHDLLYTLYDTALPCATEVTLRGQQ